MSCHPSTDFAASGTSIPLVLMSLLVLIQINILHNPSYHLTGYFAHMQEEGWLASNIHTTETVSAQNALCTLR